MSQLIQMRQRMKAIETIKKITHAMRLISMSMHTRLRSKKKYLEEYKKELHKLFGQTSNLVQDWHHDIMFPESDGDHLVILVGSQKGLCGSFNQNIYFFAEKEMVKIEKDKLKLIIIGKKIADYSKITYGEIIKQFDEFNFTILNSLTDEITSHIQNRKKPYSKVTIFSNTPKSFFAQQPIATNVIPFEELPENKEVPKDFIWEQNPDSILDILAKRLLYITLQETLFSALIAEQAARFIAMDSSTRNAKNLLEAMRLNYNKLRQTKITRELTDLVGSFF